MHNGQKVWASILDSVKQQVSSSTFKTWFAGSYALEQKKTGSRSVLVVELRNNFIKEQLKTKYGALIRQITSEKGFLETDVIFVVTKNVSGTNSSHLAPLFSGIAQTYIASRRSESLNIAHTFENFVVGSSNNLAFLAARQVAENLGRLYNPLFIWGLTGVGKTHLLQAVGNEVLTKTIDAKVLYVTCEKFTNDFIESIGNRSTQAFRHKYRNVDVLLIDDVQFLMGKEGTQDEFFHTFNELYLAGKQIILASDRRPQELARIKERLVSRFLGGMICDIARPDLELRVAILKSKCRARSVVLPGELINYIAGTCETGARELEGVLIQVLSLHRLSGGISLDEVKKTLGTSIKVGKARPSPGKIIEVVSRHFKIASSDLCGSRRKSSLVRARQILMFLLREDLGLGLANIGQLVGGRDHSTVIYGIDRVGREIALNQNKKDEIARIRLSF